MADVNSERPGCGEPEIKTQKHNSLSEKLGKMYHDKTSDPIIREIISYFPLNDLQSMLRSDKFFDRILTCDEMFRSFPIRMIRSSNKITYSGHFLARNTPKNPLDLPTMIANSLLAVVYSDWNSIKCENRVHVDGSMRTQTPDIPRDGRL